MANDSKTSDSTSDVSDPRDEAVLAGLGYKQEFKRAFSPWESFGIAFNIIGLVPSMACAARSYPWLHLLMTVQLGDRVRAPKRRTGGHGLGRTSSSLREFVEG